MHQEVKTHRKLLLMLSVVANVVSPDIALPPRSIEFSQLSEYTPSQLLAYDNAFNTDRRIREHLALRRRPSLLPACNRALTPPATIRQQQSAKDSLRRSLCERSHRRRQKSLLDRSRPPSEIFSRRRPLRCPPKSK